MKILSDEEIKGIKIKNQSTLRPQDIRLEVTVEDRAIAQAAHDNCLRQVKEWGESKCPHHDEMAEQRNYDFKRECDKCWQELGEKRDE